MSKFDDLLAKLREVFQIDQPELDFGIYRIINQRAADIDRYLTETLGQKVQEELNKGSSNRRAELQEELKQKEEQYRSDGVDPDTVPKITELRKQIADMGDDVDYETEVYSHLLRFFSRYYDKGDFISRRRYKGDTYAIPYDGEEVLLHWANKDQYYTKSSESFTHYRFTLSDGRKVHFRLITADTAKNNNKDTNGQERRFALAEPSDDHPQIITEADGELIVRFEYKVFDKGTKQGDLVAEAVKAILDDETVTKAWTELIKSMPTEKNPDRTLLEKHLNDYTRKNTADYFIHKDLAGFLSRELDFYIKNEVMNLDDVQNVATFGAIEKQLRMIQTLRAIALDLTRFLAQIEDFQKKLWLKKKFVVETNYCITLDRVPEQLYPEIASNDAQREEWIRLFAINEIKGQNLGQVAYSEPLTTEFLKANPFLAIDTALFDDDFRHRLLGMLEHLDEQIEGVLIQSENSQALNLLQNKYREQLRCIYIDPPYNTSENAFLYKNQYKHSSWLAMVGAGLSFAPVLNSSDGVIIGAIDDTEYSNFKTLLTRAYGEDNYVGTVAVEVNPAGQNIRPNAPARSHDYFHVFAKNIDLMQMILRELTSEELSQYTETDEIGSFYWDNLRRRGGNSRPVDRPKQWFPLYITEKDVRVPEMKWNQEENKWEALEAKRPDEMEVWPIDPKGERRIWRMNPDGAKGAIKAAEISIIKKAGRLEVSKKSRVPEGKKPKTLWCDSRYSATTHGTKLLIGMFGTGVQFSYPKSLYLTQDAIGYWADRSATVLDFFSGSGTTGHAVMNLNRLDKGSRKYILIEIGEYFKNVTIPRMLKAAYSQNWTNGKPKDRDTGISHCLKYIRLESYEDTMNNLLLQRTGQQGDLLAQRPDLAQDYLLGYMLDIESRASLLNTDSFKKPFDYWMHIATDSAGATEPRKVDLVETFNYLVGLRVDKIDARLDRGYLLVEGKLPGNERTLVIWRDCEHVGHDDLKGICDRLNINPLDTEYGVIYINGDHNIPNIETGTDADGEITRTLKVR
jgi:adenine-specific DNA-methyltransferase